MKVCKECNQAKEIDDFYVHKKMADGHLNKCIECVKARVLKHRNANLEKIKEYDRLRANQPKRVEARKEYAKSEKGKKTHEKAMKTYYKNYPLKYASKVITRKAIRNGELIKSLNCSKCGSDEKIEGHHDDYTKPLEVRWLCEKCHKEWHRHNKPIYE